MSKKQHAVITRWNQLRLGLCWKSSVLAPALAALTLIEASPRMPFTVRTAAIDNRGRMYIDTTWAAKLSDGEANFTILHECLHMVLRHWERRSSRDPELWNFAGDLCINEAIPKLGAGIVTQPPPGVLDRATHTPDIPAGLSTEEIYEYLRADPEKVPQGFGEGAVGGGCGVVMVEVDENGDPIDPADSPANAAVAQELGLSPNEWKNIAQSVATLAKSASTTGGAALAPLLAIPPSRVRWQALLRELAAAAISRAGRDVTSWSRRSRRSPRRVILPGSMTRDVRLAIIIDSSGSMSDAELSACIAETHAAINAAGVSAYLVVHDHEVRTKTWIAPGSGVTCVAEKVIGRGGTCFTEAYEVVADAKAKFAAVIHFTDGYPGDEWPATPGNCGRAVCALTPDGRAASVPDGWRVVPIEIPGRC